MRAEHLTITMALASALLVAGGCDDMADQPRRETFEASTFFDDGASARPLVEGVVPRSDVEQDPVLMTGRTSEGLVVASPIPVTAQVLQRGRQRYDIFCAPCHGRVGDGRGIVALRGFPMPPTLHDDRLRRAPDGHIFDVITHGYGKMPAYARQVPIEDRWAIVTYVRALQRSQHATEADVPAEQRAQLEEVAP